jgi:hypothetical protein
MDTVGIPITALTMQTLGPEQARMGQGLLGVMRSIGSSFGVAVTSVFFERRRAWHQFQAYTAYDNVSPAHEATLGELRLSLHHAGVGETLVDQEALGIIREQMDIEAIALGFQESFLFICLCFLLAIGPMLCLLSRRITAQSPVTEGRKSIKV